MFYFCFINNTFVMMYKLQTQAVEKIVKFEMFTEKGKCDKIANVSL